MYHKTRGIVIHSVKYSETSLITKIYTEKFGLQSYIVKGVRAAKSKSKAAMLQPLTLLDLEVSHRENKGLQFIKEFQRAFVFQSIPFNTIKSTLAFFLLEVLSKCILESEPNEGLFDFIYQSVVGLDEQEKVCPDFHLIFMLYLATHLGFGPQENFSNTQRYFNLQDGTFTSSAEVSFLLNEKESSDLYFLMQKTLFDHTKSKLSRTDRNTALHNLLKYYALHLENFSLKSPEVLTAILD